MEIGVRKFDICVVAPLPTPAMQLPPLSTTVIKF